MAQGIRGYINKSKAGHYKVTIFVGKSRVFRSVKLSTLGTAQQELKHQLSILTKSHKFNELGICIACKQITGREDITCKGSTNH
jgi:hypothetical protein